MERILDKDLRNLRLKISKMSQLAIQMVEMASAGLFNRDDEILDKAIKTDKEVDILDNDIDSVAMRLCALRNPEATDLRFVLSSIRIDVAIERIADNAVNIAEWSKKLNRNPQLKPYLDIPNMKNVVMEMVNDAVDGFLSYDVEKSKEVIKKDDIVDEYEMQITRELLTFVMEDTKNIKSVLNLMFIARAFERIGDQATNIAEQTIFIATGEVYKHRRKKD